MVGRIGDYAMTGSLINHLHTLQRKVYDAQIMVSSEKKSDTYRGIAGETQRLLNIENLSSMTARYMRNNTVVGLRLEVANQSYEAAEKVIRDMRDRVDAFIQGDLGNETQVNQIQDWAFKALDHLQSYMNAEVDGEYIFAGSRVHNMPVDFNLSSLANFQAKWDGQTVTYPTTRDGHLVDVSTGASTAGGFTIDGTASTITAANAVFGNYKAGSTITLSGTTSNDGTYTVSSATSTVLTVQKVSLTTDATDTGPTITLPNQADLSLNAAQGDFTSLDFTAPGTLTMNGGTFPSTIKVGHTVTISGANTAANNGSYTVTANGGGTLTLKSKTLTTENVLSTASATVAANSWYSGDTHEKTHRIDKDISVDMDVNATTPAFEKAIRAMGIIAQGAFGSAGGLDQNQNRAEEALYLLDSALDTVTGGTPPYGTELSGDMNQLGFDIGFKLTLMNDTETRFTKLSALLDTQSSEIENVDMAEAIARLQDEARALEAAYNAYALTQKLSLSDYI